MAAPGSYNKTFTTVDANNQITACATGTGSTTPITVFTAGTNGAVVRAIGMVSNDTVAANVILTYTPFGGSAGIIGGVSITGNATLQSPTNLLTKTNIPFAEYDSQGNVVIQMKSGDTLNTYTVATMTSAKAYTVSVQGADFAAS